MKKFFQKFIDKYATKQDTHINVLTVNRKVAWTEEDAVGLREFYNTPLGQKFLGKIESGVVDVHGWACSYEPNKSYEHSMGTANGYKTFYAHILQLATIHRISEREADNQVTESLLERLKT